MGVQVCALFTHMMGGLRSHIEECFLKHYHRQITVILLYSIAVLGVVRTDSRILDGNKDPNLNPSPF